MLPVLKRVSPPPPPLVLRDSQPCVGLPFDEDGTVLYLFIQLLHNQKRTNGVRVLLFPFAPVATVPLPILSPSSPLADALPVKEPHCPCPCHWHCRGLPRQHAHVPTPVIVRLPAPDGGPHPPDLAGGAGPARTRPPPPPRLCLAPSGGLPIHLSQTAACPLLVASRAFILHQIPCTLSLTYITPPPNPSI